MEIRRIEEDKAAGRNEKLWAKKSKTVSGRILKMLRSRLAHEIVRKTRILQHMLLLTDWVESSAVLFLFSV